MFFSPFCQISSLVPSETTSGVSHVALTCCGHLVFLTDWPSMFRTLLTYSRLFITCILPSGRSAQIPSMDHYNPQLAKNIRASLELTRLLVMPTFYKDTTAADVKVWLSLIRGFTSWCVWGGEDTYRRPSGSNDGQTRLAWCSLQTHRKTRRNHEID